MPVLLGIPLWAWLTGGAVVMGGSAVVIDQTGDTLDSATGAIDSSTRLASVLILGGVLYGSYRLALTAGAIK